VEVAAGSMVYSTTHGDTVLLIRRIKGVNERLVVLAPRPLRPVPAFDICNVRGDERQPLLSAQLIFGGSADRVIFNVDGHYALSILQKGRSPRVFKRARAQERLTAKEVVRLLGDSLRMLVKQRPCAVPTTLVAEQAGIAKSAPAYSAIVAGPTGLIWAVRMAAKGEVHRADVYSALTGYVGTAVIGAANPVAILSDGALVSSETDDDDVPRLVIYDVAIQTRR